jgi:type I restriction enzyme R subunit
VVGEAIEIQHDGDGEDTKPYDISKINFDRLKDKVESYPAKRTTVQTLKQAIEPRLKGLLAQNPRRTNLQRHYEEIVAEYNSEKDPAIIENTLEALLRFVGELDEEGVRATREDLDEESLAVFDLLKKPDLSDSGTERIKSVGVGQQ